MRLVVTGIGTALLMCLLLGSEAFQAGEKAKPKLTIKEVMRQAHAGAQKSLLAKVASGQATKEDKAKLVALYVALSQNDPPRGDLEAWKKSTGNMVELAKKAESGDAEATQALQKVAEVTSCMACHSMHKAKKKITPPPG